MTVDGIHPGDVAAPHTIAEFAGTLAAAATARRLTVISGGGTKLSWGRTPAAVDLLVSTARLNRVLAHRYGDLTATIEAGATLADVNRQLAQHGQCLPLDSAFAGATIGGIVATNDAGPLRHRFGTPRDLLIGATLALADGRLVKAGGTVVKNVAGYDLARLVSGSFGSLAAIVTATFKLAPLPAATGTIGALYHDAVAIGRDAQLLASHQFELTALDVQAASGAQGFEYRLLVRLASSPVATNTQLEAIHRMLGSDAQRVEGAAEGDLWNDQVAAPWFGDGVTLRLAWLPATLGELLIRLAEMAKACGMVVAFTGRAGVGAGLLRLNGPADGAVRVVERLRRTDVVGNVVVLRAPVDVKARVDVWGQPPEAAPVMHAIKRALDPSGILNAGRGPI